MEILHNWIAYEFMGALSVVIPFFIFAFFLARGAADGLRWEW